MIYIGLCNREKRVKTGLPGGERARKTWKKLSEEGKRVSWGQRKIRVINLQGAVEKEGQKAERGKFKDANK